MVLSVPRRGNKCPLTLLTRARPGAGAASSIRGGWQVPTLHLRARDAFLPKYLHA